MLTEILRFIFHLYKCKTRSTSNDAPCHQAGSLEFHAALLCHVWCLNSRLQHLFHCRQKLQFTPAGTQCFGLLWAGYCGVLSPFWSYPLGVRACSVVSDSLRPHGLQHTRFFCPWDFPGKNTGVGCHFFLQGVFPTQGSNPCLLFSYTGRQILCH